MPDTPTTDPGRHDDVARLAADYWELVMETNPTWATLLGDHRFDDRVEDLSEDGEQAEADALEGLSRRLRPLEELSAAGIIHGTDRVTVQLLRTALDDRRRTIDLRLAELSSDQMDGPHVAYLMSAPQMAAETPEHADLLVARIERLGTALDAARGRWTAGASRGRTPAALCVERSIHSVAAYLASPLDDDLFVQLRGPEGWSGEAAWRERLRAAVEGSLRPAYQRVHDTLTELRAVARPDDRAGLCWLDDGDEIYATLLRLHTSLDLDPRDVHEIGVQRLERDLPEEYRTIGRRALGTDDLGEVFSRIRDDASLRFGSPEEIVTLAESTVARGREAMGQLFGRLPRAACRVEPVPDVLAADSSAAYYFPPTEDGSRPGTYFVNRRNATEQSRVEAESIAFHEAIPGHHLQLAIATELEDLPAFRRLGVGNTAYVEGWALYAERLADEIGLYSDDVARLGMLVGDSWRSGRLVVDTGLHALGWSRQRARDHLWDRAPVGREELEAEIDRYVAIPGQAVSYAIGQREITRLRQRAADALGDRFDLAAFHDVVLGSGGVTLPVLADVVDGWVAANSPRP